MRRAMCELMYPKPQKKKKRKHHPAPIVETYPGICYLCAKEEGNWNYQYTECHHVVFGGGGRTRSEWFKSIFVPETPQGRQRRCT